MGQADNNRVEDKGLVDAWLKVSLDHAKAYHIAPQSQPDAPFKLLPNPIFRHSQPVRGDDIGAVYLWLDVGGRPAVIGTVFAYSAGEGARWVAHEMHSLSDQPFTARWEQKTTWAPNQKGIQWRSIADAPSPAETPAQRLIQMRSLARRFQATSTEVEGKNWQLRLISNPVYRNDQKRSPTTLDGAVFLFCQGTDPEIILLLEARKEDNKKDYQWQCGFAAFSDYALRAELDGQEIWQVGRIPQRSNRDPHWIDGQFRLTRLSDVEAVGKDNE
ncbi:MAG: hypothetical protein O3C40_25550 [Planctomycetota bacterium]|nr:hypothetical protein [Planctomycetota bacterium]